MEQVQQWLKKAVQRAYDVDVTPQVSVAPAETGADYASNVAMQLAKLVHKNPMVIAEELAASDGEEDAQQFAITIAAPGFLNFSFKDEHFAKIVDQLAGGVKLHQKLYADKVAVTEFSDPNPFKVLHVGHLYTSVVGDSISRLLELAGAKVERVNFGGDVGLHVGKTLWAVLERGYEIDDLTIEKLAECYVEGTAAYEDNEAAKSRIVELNKEIYRINAEDEHEGLLAGLYWRGRELSYQYFDEFYEKIGVKFDKYYPESAVAGRGLQEVRAHTGTVYEESDGAVVYRGEKVGLHTRVFINREGVPTYEAKDVGLIFTKWDDYHFDESVVVTGNEQTEYMKVVLASVAEYAPQLVEKTRHLTHGLVKLPGNVKMSSRKGNFLRAVDVLEMIREILGGEKADNRVVLAAIKYAFLKYKMGGNIVFDPQESVSTTGNSGVYLLYSAVRAKKVLAKAGGEIISAAKNSDDKFEKALSKKLVQYEEILGEAIAEKAPNKVCTYLYELAQEFSRFYENVKVAGSEREGELVRLVKAYLNVMEHGLGLLGIEVPEEM